MVVVVGTLIKTCSVLLRRSATLHHRPTCAFDPQATSVHLYTGTTYPYIRRERTDIKEGRGLYLFVGDSLPCTGLCPGAYFESDSSTSAGLSVSR